MLKVLLTKGYTNFLYFNKRFYMRFVQLEKTKFEINIITQGKKPTAFNWQNLLLIIIAL